MSTSQIVAGILAVVSLFLYVQRRRARLDSQE
jgi:hypothetical protein